MRKAAPLKSGATLRAGAAKDARRMAGQARLPGSLNKLTLELQSSPDSGESFYLHSEHYVRLLSEASPSTESRPPPSQPSTSSRRQQSQSATPSPQKAQRHRPSVLTHWTVRLCQRIDRQGAQENGSETEEDDDDDGETVNVQHTIDNNNIATAWYIARINAARARQLCEELEVERWDKLESSIRTAWELGRVDVLARSAKNDNSNDNGDHDDDDDGDTRQHEEICLSFMLEDIKHCERFEHQKAKIIVKKEDEDDADDNAAPPSPQTQDKSTRLLLTLRRLDDRSAVNEASLVAIEMMTAFGTLKTRTQSLVEERDSHRKLLKDNKRHERFKEASTSLINPGRIKRKVQDDGGFEGEDE